MTHKLDKIIIGAQADVLKHRLELVSLDEVVALSIVPAEHLVPSLYL